MTDNEKKGFQMNPVENHIKTNDLERILFTPPFQEVFAACSNKTAYRDVLRKSVFLISLLDGITHIGKIPPMLKESSLKGDDSSSSTIDMVEEYADLSIRLFEIITGARMEDNIEVATKIASDVSLMIRDTRYHGTNSTALNKIRETGISSTQRESDVEELEMITALLKALTGGNEALSLGSYDIDSRNTFFLTGAPEKAVGYAYRSPEWFNRFAGGIPFQDYNHTRAHRYMEQAIKYVRKLNLNRRKNKGIKPMTINDERIIMDFFEKYWLRYGSAEPVVCVVKLPHDIDADIILAAYLTSGFLGDLKYGDFDKTSAQKLLGEVSDTGKLRTALVDLITFRGMLTSNVIDSDIPTVNIQPIILPPFEPNLAVA